MLTNDELKKKIISALQSVEFVTEKGWCGQCISLRLDYSAIADALIAAGLTFDDEWKHRAGYRKASDVIDEFVERLKEGNEISFRRYGKGIGISTIFRIADEMRQEVEK